MAKLVRGEETLEIEDGLLGGLTIRAPAHRLSGEGLYEIGVERRDEVMRFAARGDFDLHWGTLRYARCRVIVDADERATIHALAAGKVTR